MLRKTLALAAFVGLLVPATAAPPTPNADPKSLEVAPDELSKARELVQKLGSDAYVEREDAQRELAAMGRVARQALLDGANLDPDPEVRARCGELIPKANAEEFKVRLETFMADTDGKYEHDLPGWYKLRATVRGEVTLFGWTYTAREDAATEKAARELFIEFMKTPGGRKLLAALDGPPEDLGRLVSTRKQELYSSRFPRTSGVAARQASATEVVVVMFAESQVHTRHVPRSTVLTSVITSSGLSSLLHGSSPRAMALQSVMNAWFDSRTEPYELYSALTIANNMNSDQIANRIAARMMTMASVPAAYKGQALTTLVRNKAMSQLPMLEKTFTDNSALITVAKNVNGKLVRQTIEMRDAALAAALVLTNQDVTDYGFEAFPKGVANFNYSNAKIPEEKRAEAFEKWNKWRQKNP